MDTNELNVTHSLFDFAPKMIISMNLLNHFREPFLHNDSSVLIILF